MATVTNVLNYAQLLAQTDTNGIDSTNTTGNGLAFCNDALQNMTRSLLEKNINAAQLQESYTDLTVNSPNTYAWPADMFSLKTLELNFTDGQQANFVQAQKMDVSNLQFSTSFDWLRVNQSTTSPMFMNYGDTFEVFPTPLTKNSNGVRIFYWLTPTEFTAFANTLSYPQTLDYRCVGARVAALYALSVVDMDRYAAYQAEYEKRLNDIIRILAPQSQQPIHPQPLRVTGFEF